MNFLYRGAKFGYKTDNQDHLILRKSVVWFCLNKEQKG